MIVDLPPQHIMQAAACARSFDRAAFHRAARKVYRHGDAVVTRHESRVIRVLIRCQGSATSRRIVRRHLTRYKRTHHQRWYWVIRRARLSWSDKVWTVRTSSCESGRDPGKNTGNGYFGAFQFSASTARAAGFGTLPHHVSLAEQDVRSIRWRNIAGRGQWPVCGR